MAQRRGSAHTERDDSALDEAARERVLGQDLDPVRVAEEPFEVHENARADGGDLLQAFEIEESDPDAEGLVIEEARGCLGAKWAEQQGGAVDGEALAEQEARAQLDRAAF